MFGIVIVKLSCSQSDGSNEASSTRYGVLLDAPLCHAPSILKKNKTQLVMMVVAELS